MKNLLYFVSGLIFAVGLGVSGMADPQKVQNFLNVFGDSWSPGLLFVLSTAVLVYGLSFFVLRNRKKTLNGFKFGSPPPRPVNKRLILGSIIFGIGWGLLGLCPGPALVNTFNLGVHGVVFLLMMFAGFEVERRLV